MSAPETPARRGRLDPSPEEIRVAREQMEHFLAKETAAATRMGYQSMRSEWSDANAYTIGAVTSSLDESTRRTGPDVTKFVRLARASLAALDGWKTARTAALTAKREARGGD